MSYRIMLAAARNGVLTIAKPAGLGRYTARCFHHLSVDSPSQVIAFGNRRRFCSRSTAAQASRRSEQDTTEVDLDSVDYVLFSEEDVTYLWKLTAGSFGGASAIKYGSILYPDITRPNIIQALLMISLPVLVAVLILIKESMAETKNNEVV